MTQDRGGRRWPWITVAGALVLAGTAALTLRGDPPSPSASATAEIDARVHEARAAAARSYFVYPPPDDPEYRTANRIVVELEAIEGAAADSARQRAAALRDEFADTLVRLADRLWDAEGGAPFAIDYYAQALVFDPQLARARERARGSRSASGQRWASTMAARPLRSRSAATISR